MSRPMMDQYYIQYTWKIFLLVCKTSMVTTHVFAYWYDIPHFVLQLPEEKKKNSVAVVRKQTIPTEWPPLVSEVSANLCGKRVLRGQRNKFPRPLISVF
jgi:hypothetical protein